MATAKTTNTIKKAPLIERMLVMPGVSSDYRDKIKGSSYSCIYFAHNEIEAMGLLGNLSFDIIVFPEGYDSSKMLEYISRKYIYSSALITITSDEGAPSMPVETALGAKHMVKRYSIDALVDLINNNPSIMLNTIME